MKELLRDLWKLPDAKQKMVAGSFNDYFAAGGSSCYSWLQALPCRHLSIPCFNMKQEKQHWGKRFSNRSHYFIVATAICVVKSRGWIFAALAVGVISLLSSASSLFIAQVLDIF